MIRIAVLVLACALLAHTTPPLLPVALGSEIRNWQYTWGPAVLAALAVVLAGLPRRP